MKYIDDILILIGIIIIIGTTYYINWIVGNYLLALFLMLIGLVFAKKE